jgi:hypothetical protein
MTSREIFLAALDFAPVKRNLKWDFGYWGGTLHRWQKEGLPRDLKLLGPKREVLYGEFINGPGIPYPMPSYDDNVLFASGVSRVFMPTLPI